MKSSTVDTLIHTDPVLGVFRTFGELNDLPVSLSLSMVPYEDMPYTVADHAKQHGSQLVLLPWLPPSSSGDGPSSPKTELNPFESFFGGSKGTNKSAAAIHSQFVRGVFAESKTDVALFIDPGVSDARVTGAGTGSARHVFCPFFGGPDDRLALEFVVQLCANPRITATVVRMSKSGTEGAALGRPSLVHLEKKTSFESSSTGMPLPAVRHISLAAFLFPTHAHPVECRCSRHVLRPSHHRNTLSVRDRRQRSLGTIRQLRFHI